MSGRGALRRLRIGRRRGCRGDGWVRRGPRAGCCGGEDCRAVSAPASPGLRRPDLRSWVARVGGPREPPEPVSPRRPPARGAPPSAFVSTPRICGCQLPSVASPAGGAMGCGNSTAASAGAGQELISPPIEINQTPHPIPTSKWEGRSDAAVFPRRE
ncbi:overexpressed in colon carcinoma 1 protein isoform X5 [Bos javanicus]|uniref:overexpressed in colon carcinoma 1 protein isoform X5 n=1 Tax=Bos javanicus TaxID=9906 RepID=UPI002AA6CEE9|nr:overexpressed in colon carcinoma 1 protein isoform X5 [Bos javanicus]